MKIPPPLFRHAAEALAVVALLVLPLHPTTTRAAGYPPGGAFVLSFGRPASDHASIRRFVESSGRFQEIVEELNATFRLPTRVRIVFGEGDGPEYDPSNRTITMSYGFVENVIDIFGGESGLRGDELRSNVLGVCEFALYHEMGHAFVDVYDLPITGREEDSVDALATVMAVVMERHEIALAEVQLLAAWVEDREEFSNEDFWDEHSLDEQRTYALVCWLYGSDPETFQELSDAAEFDEEREAKCEEQWRQISTSWLRLLEPHMRNSR